MQKEHGSTPHLNSARHVTDKKNASRSATESLTLKEGKCKNRKLEELSLEEIQLMIHELKEHQSELKMQNEELRRAQAELESVKTRYLNIYDLAPEGYLIVSEEGFILESNLTAATMLGATKVNLIKRRLSEYICKEYQDNYYIHRSKLFKTLKPEECELRIVKNDGTTFWARLKAAVVTEGGLPVCRLILSDVSERKKLEEKLQDSEIRFRSTFEQAAVGISHVGLNGRWLLVNHKLCDILGYTPEELLQRTARDITHPDDLDYNLELVDKMLNGHIETFTLEKRYIRRDRSIVWVNLTVSLARKPSGDPNYSIAVVEDITARKQMEDANREHEARFRSFVEQAPVAIDVATPEGFGLYANEKFLEILGLDSVSEHIGRPTHTYFAPQCIEDYTARRRRRMEGMSVPPEYESVLVRPDGSEFPVHFATTQIHLPSGRVLIAFLTDISERKKAESELLYLSTHDHLTELHNRRFFEQELQVLDTEDNLPLSVIMCDVNGLKLVNDSFGHTLGDVLLKKAAQSIKQVCREEDLIARIGGDEFVILLPRTTAEETLLIASQIKDLASTGMVGNVELSISYGYDTKTNDKQSIVEIIANAENHMYRHKLSERSSIRSKTIDLIINSLFEKSNREAAHSNRVGNICQAIASKMNLDKDDVNQMKIAGIIHDIGKIGIDEKILNKTGSLTIDERLNIERHPEIGWRLLGSTNEFSQLAQFVLYHHEKWDGSGYPNGLKGKEIPCEARIITVADAYDAMTSERSYRPSLSQEEAIQELRRCSGTQFDPEIVDVFINQVLKDDNDFRQHGE